MKLFAVQTGRTIWEEESRTDSLAGAPLCEQGRDTVKRVATELKQQSPSVLYTGAGESEQETAKLIAKSLGLKVRTTQELDEIDYGLWQGLTTAEIKHRQPKLHRQWREAPGSVCPPGGETLADAQDRICEVIQEILRKEKKGTPLIVLRPVVCGLLRCRIKGGIVADLWDYVSDEFTWKCFEDEELDCFQ